jgi:release factor glutamine methyltransferase
VTLKQALNRAREVLVKSDIEDASLEGEVLLRHVMKIDRAGLYSQGDRQLSVAQEKAFWRLVERRLCGEPTAYIIGCREFYGLDFYIDRRVLIPRPETELLVEKALALAQTRTIDTIADIGTGCGAIAISLALNLPKTKIYATDVSADALEVTRINCRKHEVDDRIQLLHGGLLEPLPEPIDLIVANLPYVTEGEISRSGLDGFEPRLALDGGRDGLDEIKRLCRQSADKLSRRGCMLLEVGQGQSRSVTDLACRFFPSASIEVTPDLGGIERIVGLYLTSNLARC